MAVLAVPELSSILKMNSKINTKLKTNIQKVEFSLNDFLGDHMQSEACKPSLCFEQFCFSGVWISAYINTGKSGKVTV